MRKPLARAALVAVLALGMSTPALARGHFGFHRVPGAHHSMRVARARGHVPPGWHRGRKVGWGRGHVPPGLRQHRR